MTIEKFWINQYEEISKEAWDYLGKMAIPKPCQCGYNRWRTINKHHDQLYFRRYKCRKCGFDREISRKEDVDGGKGFV